MKKFVTGLLSLVSVICIAFAFVGCGNNSGNGSTVEGDIYNLAYAHRMGWIDEFDLKSIACGYYEWLDIEANPYSGLYKEPTEQLSEDIQNKIIEEYGFQTEDTKVLKYYGTYDGNIVITLGDQNGNYDEAEEDINLNGVIFPKLRLYGIWVYHYPERVDDSVTAGRIYRIEKAYEKELLNENDLKSIACYVNDRNTDVENPYSGMYEPPTQKLSAGTKIELKQAFLSQIDKYPDDLLDGIIIHKYYGTYNGNVVVSMTGYSCGFPVEDTGTEIGGVIFNHYSWSCIYVYKVQ